MIEFTNEEAEYVWDAIAYLIESEAAVFELLELPKGKEIVLAVSTPKRIFNHLENIEALIRIMRKIVLAFEDSDILEQSLSDINRAEKQLSQIKQVFLDVNDG